MLAVLVAVLPRLSVTVAVKVTVPDVFSSREVMLTALALPTSGLVVILYFAIVAPDPALTLPMLTAAYVLFWMYSPQLRAVAERLAT